MMAKLAHDDYTVGWISALPLEMTAANAMLDEVHAPLSQLPTDENSYTLGRVEGHNVVMCCLPSGVYGTTSAATVLAHMKSTFPLIRFGLMVGIGGGVPHKLDIRLGDVVVSTPNASGNGVIQYDYGKTESDGIVHPTGHLNKPPQFLLTALSLVRGKQMSIKQFITDAPNKGGQLIDELSRPSDDLLFYATYDHQDKNNDCSTCDLKKLVDRVRRDNDEPHVHYGLIASGNQVMKNARIRDRIAKQLDIICFEMEAAGLMDQLPSLVIRGISDYCDSHKQDQWQNYAALTAAAYARLLLSVVRTNAPLALTRADPSEVDACMRGLGVTHPIGDINALKRCRGNRASGTCEWILETDELNSWLALQDESESNPNILWLYGNPGVGKTTMAITIVELLSNQPDFSADGDRTLSYFIRNSSSADWRTATAILRSILYQLLDQRSQLMKYILPKFKIRREELFTSFDALWATLMDIGRDSANGQFYCIIDALDECDQKSQKVLLDQLRQTFENNNANVPSLSIHFLITSRPYREIEERLPPAIRKDLSSDPKTRDDLQTFINERVSYLSKTRHYTEKTKRTVSELLRQKAEGTFLWVGIVCQKLEDVQSKDAANELKALPSDLNSMYSYLLEKAFESAPNDREITLKILSCVAVSRRSLTVAELAAACKLYESENEEERLSWTLESIKNCRLMVVVQDGFVRLLHQSMKDFLLCSQRDNLINELEANAVLAYRCLDYLLLHIKLLENIQKEEPSHGFLEYAILYWPEHASAARSEFSVQPAHRSFFQLVSDDREIWLESYHYQLYYYSSKFSYTQARCSIFHVAAKWGLPCLVDFAAPKASVRLPFPWIGRYSETYKVAQYMLSITTEQHRWRNWVNTRDERGRTSLHWAILKQHVEVIVALIDRNADVDIQDDELKCALHFAAEAGGDEILRMFLKLPKNLERKDGHGRTPVLIAAENLQLEAIGLLINAGAQAHALNNKHQNILHLMCQRQNYDCKLIERLIKDGISTCTCDADNMTPYLYAIGTRQKDLVRAFLRNGLDVNRPIHRRRWTSEMRNGFRYYEQDETHQQSEESGIGLTMLHFSALNGMADMTDFLLCHGANPNALNDVGDTPLHLAIRSNISDLQYEDPWITGTYAVEMLADCITDFESEEASQIYKDIERARIRIVDVLLKSKTIDVNIANNYGDYPIHEVPFHQVYAHAILSSLIDCGADLSVLNQKRQTCLHLASKEGNLDAVCRLMDEGCDATLLDSDGLSPIHHAVIKNNPNVVRLMIQRSQKTGKAWQQVDHRGKNFLHHHVVSPICSIKMINVLLEYGCNINDLDSEGNSVLSLYLASPHPFFKAHIAQFILEKASPDCIDWINQKGENLMHLLMRQYDKDNVIILEELWRRGIDINAKDTDGRSIFHHGAMHGAFNTALVRFLQYQGLLQLHQLHEKDQTGKTPLEYAEEEATPERHVGFWQGSHWKASFHNLQCAEAQAEAEAMEVD